MKTKTNETLNMVGIVVIDNHEITFNTIRNQTFVQFSNRNSEEFDDGMFRIDSISSFIDIAKRILVDKSNDEILTAISILN